MDEYDKIATKIEAEINEKDSKLMELTNNDKSFDISRSCLLELASKARTIFENSKPEQQNKILKLLFSNLKINQKRLQFNLLEPFKSLSNCANSQKWLPLADTFRTALFSYDSEKLEEVKVILYQQNNYINASQDVANSESVEKCYNINNTDNIAKHTP
ncbi:MAG: hypothetical protein K5837_00380 [Candidatus Saccharibacteria bacterium]|nr:hypothetical protein [Candidatus Saccharibacteria bacterium]